MLYVKKVGSEVRVFGDLESLAAPVEAGGGNSASWDDTITEEQWRSCGYTARIVEGRIVYGKPADQIQQEREDAIRDERDRRLRKCDKMSEMRWLTLTGSQKAEWIAYRQALLDIPSQDGFPWGGDAEQAPWPSLPEDLDKSVLNSAVEIKLAELERAFETAQNTGSLLSSAGFEINADNTANRNIAGLVTVMEATGASTVQFMAYDDTLHTVTLEQLRTMQLEVIQYGQRLYSAKWTLRSRIEACTTAEEVNAVEVSFDDIA